MNQYILLTFPPLIVAVTKKEWVVETRTEEVEVTEAKKKSPKKTTEEPKPAAKRKQTDLMSFFGRK